MPPPSATNATYPLTMLSDSCIDRSFDATVEATEEAILNWLVAAETMVGRDSITAYSLPHDRLVDLMGKSQLASTAATVKPQPALIGKWPPSMSGRRNLS